MTPDDVSEILRTTVMMVTSIPKVIFTWPNAPRPTGSYATVGLNTITQVDFGEISDVNAIDGNIDRKLVTLFDVFISVNFYRNNALTNSALLSRGLMSQSIIDYWNESDVGLVDRSAVRNLVIKINNKFEQRSQIDITMQALIDAPVEKVLSVETVRIIGQIHNSGGIIDDVAIGPPE